MNRNLIEDLSKLTTIQKKYLNKLTSKTIFCICDCVEDSVSDRENTVDIDLGYGVLSIYHDNTDIKYKFTPSKELSEAVKDTVIKEQNLLVNSLEASLKDKIENTYKRFF